MEIIVLGFLSTFIGVSLGKLKLITAKFSKLLGRGLYRYGLPLQIFAIARKASFDGNIWFPPLITILVLLLGLMLANLNLVYGKKLSHVILTRYVNKILFYRFNYRTEEVNLEIPQHRSGKGSFLLASTLGSTGYLGLSIVPIFVGSVYSGWAALYSITQILFGSFGIGVLLASYYGSSNQQTSWSIQLKKLLKVPALWGFLIGYCCRGINFPIAIDWGLNLGVMLAISSAFLLTGIQLQGINRANCFNRAIIPTSLKMLLIPGLTGLCLTLFGVTGDARISMVLMSGMPTANTNLILAEEYNLDRQVTASTIALSTILLPITILVWKLLLNF